MHNKNTLKKRQQVLAQRKRRRKIRQRIIVSVIMMVLLLVYLSSVAMQSVGDVEEPIESQVEIEDAVEETEPIVEEVEEPTVEEVEEEIVDEFVIDPEAPMIALTFDDGPGQYTEQLLDAIEANGVHASFYVLGNRINDTNGYLLTRMQELGCEVSNHSRNHADFTTLSAEEITSQVNDTNEAIEQYTGVAVVNFRPPYGAVNQTVRDSVGMPLILWSVDTLDWKYRDVDTVVEAITTDIEDGDIILLHDIHQTSVEAAILAIPILIEQGYQLVTVEEMAAAKGVVLESGVKYFNF